MAENKSAKYSRDPRQLIKHNPAVFAKSSWLFERDENIHVRYSSIYGPVLIDPTFFSKPTHIFRDLWSP